MYMKAAMIGHWRQWWQWWWRIDTYRELLWFDFGGNDGNDDDEMIQRELLLLDFGGNDGNDDEIIQRVLLWLAIGINDDNKDDATEKLLWLDIGGNDGNDDNDDCEHADPDQNLHLHVLPVVLSL